MAGIELPEPFKRIIKGYFTLRSLKIEAAYLDSKEWHPLPEGVGCLRQYLKLTDSDTCTDCYCILTFGSDKFGVLIEDKNNNSTRSRNINDGIRQMEDTHRRLRDGYFPTGNVPLKYAFFSGVKLEGSYFAKTVAEKNAKVLFNGVSKKPIMLNNSDIQIFVA